MSDSKYAIIMESINAGHADLITTTTLFHLLWTSSVDSSDYCKKGWQELEKRMREAKLI